MCNGSVCSSTLLQRILLFRYRASRMQVAGLGEDNNINMKRNAREQEHKKSKHSTSKHNEANKKQQKRIRSKER